MNQWIWLRVVTAPDPKSSAGTILLMPFRVVDGMAMMALPPLAREFRIYVWGGALGVKVMDVNVFQLSGTSPLAQGFHQTLRHIGYRTDVDVVARLDDFDGFFRRNCLILFLHTNSIYCTIKTAARNKQENRHTTDADIIPKLLFPKAANYGVRQVFWLVQPATSSRQNVSDFGFAGHLLNLQLRA